MDRRQFLLGPDDGASARRRQPEAGRIGHLSRFPGFVSGTAANDQERQTLPRLRLTEGGMEIETARARYAKPLDVLMALVGRDSGDRVRQPRQSAAGASRVAAQRDGGAPELGCRAVARDPAIARRASCSPCWAGRARAC